WFGPLVSHLACPCTALSPDLGFAKATIKKKPGGNMRKSMLAVTLLCGAAIPAMSADAPAPDKKDAGGSFTGATANMAPGDAPGQWTRQARDYANTRYSPLTQINKQNVSRLRVAWSFSD